MLEPESSSYLFTTGTYYDAYMSGHRGVSVGLETFVNISRASSFPRQLLRSSERCLYGKKRERNYTSYRYVLAARELGS